MQRLVKPLHTDGNSGLQLARAIAFDADAVAWRQADASMVASMSADRQKAFNTEEDREDVEGHGGSNNALRAKRYVFLRGPPWSSIVLRVESLAMPQSAQVHP